MRRKPDRRLITVRRSNNDKRELVENIPSLANRQALVNRVTYEPHSKHKSRPRAFGLEPLGAVSEDATYCDGHAGFEPQDTNRIPQLVWRGITAGLIGAKQAQGDPKVIWTVDDNGWVYEARLTMPSRAVYHGYPLLPGDAMAIKVISRFSRWVLGDGSELQGNDPVARVALDAAQERYRR